MYIFKKLASEICERVCKVIADVQKLLKLFGWDV